MHKSLQIFKNFFKTCNYQLISRYGKGSKPGSIDRKKNIVYGGDLSVPTPTQSFGSILFNRMMRLDRREDIFQVDSLTRISMTTKRCLENSVALAERLKELGVKQGDSIILLGNNNLYMNVALIGVFFLGAVPLPLTYKTNLDEFITIVKSVQPKYFGFDKEYLYTFRKALTESTHFDISKIFLLNQWNDSDENGIEGLADFIRGRGKDFESFKPPTVQDPKKELALLMKAMSEGKPGRVVGITHHNLNSVIARFDSIDDGVRTKQKVLLMVQKVMWMSGIYALILSCCYGSKLVVTTDFDEEHFMKTVNDFKVTTTFLYSSKCWQLYKHVPKDAYDLSSCKEFYAVDGSLPKFLMDGLKAILNMPRLAHFPRTGTMNVNNKTSMVCLLQALIYLNERQYVCEQNTHFTKQKHVCHLRNYILDEKIGVSPKSCYGTTEFTGLVLVSLENTKKESTGRLVPEAYGKVISDKTNKNAKPNERGELCFKGSTLTKGYINDPNFNKLFIDKEGYFLSGHYGYYDEDGDFYIIDKIIHQIKYKDFKISPRELEGLIKSLNPVKDVCVVGISHPVDGEHPIAFVSLIKGQKITENEIIKYVNDNVPDQKKLRGGVIFVTKVPRYRDNGAIKRNVFKKVIGKYRLKPNTF